MHPHRTSMRCSRRFGGWSRAAPVRGASLSIVWFTTACASPTSGGGVHAVAPNAVLPSDEDRVHTMAFVRTEDVALDWLAAADPRLASRADVTAPDDVLRRVGLDGVLAEDPSAQIR